MQKQTTPVYRLLKHSMQSFSAILARIAINEKALEASKQALPAFLSGHCVNCIVRENHIIVFTDAAAWASQLRFYAPSILRSIEKVVGGRYPILQVRVLKPWNTLPTTQKAPRRPSRETIAQIRQNARDTTDPRLQQSLLRLSRALDSCR